MTNDTQTEGSQTEGEAAPAPQADAPAAHPADEAIDARAQFAAAQEAARQRMFTQLRISVQATIVAGIVSSGAPEADDVTVTRAGRIADMILGDNGITRA